MGKAAPGLAIRCLGASRRFGRHRAHGLRIERLPKGLDRTHPMRREQIIQAPQGQSGSGNRCAPRGFNPGARKWANAKPASPPTRPRRLKRSCTSSRPAIAGARIGAVFRRLAGVSDQYPAPPLCSRSFTEAVVRPRLELARFQANPFFSAPSRPAGTQIQRQFRCFVVISPALNCSR